MIFTWLIACSSLPDVVTLSGVVHDEPEARGALVAGVALTVVDSDEVVVGEAVSGGDGAFIIDTPAGQPFYLGLVAEDHVSTYFSGTAGVTDFTAGDGYPWIATPEWLDTVRADFAACPTVGTPGGVVAGDVRMTIDGVNDFQALPPVDNAVVTVYTPDGTVSLTTCYHDDDGVSVAGAVDTGRDGAFAVFGVPAGAVAVEVVFQQSETIFPSVIYTFVVGESGFVPLYPALVSKI